MAFLEISNVSVRGISACVPRTVEKISDIYPKWGDYEQFISTTGIACLHKTNKETCSTDLCLTAANKLIEDLNWSKSDIEVVVFVSQTPDYILPSSSCLIQNKLGLSQDCYTLDISLGCSGWVYALSVIAALMQNGTLKKGLLLAGDTVSKLCSPEDKSTYPLFGDAGTALALEYDACADDMRFCLNSDGAGFNTIMLKDGGYRNPVTPDSFRVNVVGDGIVRNSLNLELDGMSVFSFGISKAPMVVKNLLENSGIDMEQIDYYLFHQANLFMNEKIRKKLKIQPEKVPYSLSDYGNTSCASIPLTMVTQMRDRLQNNLLKHIGCGFGVGLSWGAVYFSTNNIVCSELIEI